MSDLIRKLEKELADWYDSTTWTEERETQRGGQTNKTLLVGFGKIKVPHPTINTELRVYRVIPPSELADLLTKPFGEVGYTEIEGTWKAAREAHFSIHPLAFDPANTDYFEVEEADTEGYCGSDEVPQLLPEEVAGFIRRLKNSSFNTSNALLEDPFSPEMIMDYDTSDDLNGGSLERTISGWGVNLMVHGVNRSE